MYWKKERKRQRKTKRKKKEKKRKEAFGWQSDLAIVEGKKIFFYREIDEKDAVLDGR